jgi:hypothetical protein
MLFFHVLLKLFGTPKKLMPQEKASFCRAEACYGMKYITKRAMKRKLPGEPGSTPSHRFCSVSFR